jgi:hypothetical protein
LRKPITRLLVCCARAPSGRAAAAEQSDEFASFHRITAQQARSS